MNTALFAEKPATMSHAQYTYALAKAAFETVNKNIQVKVRAIYDGIDHNQSEEEFQRYLNFAAEEQIRIQNESRFDDFQRLLTQAEDQLIAWAGEQTAKQPLSKKHPEALKAFTDPRARRAPHRQNLVDICFKANFPEVR